MTKFHIGDWEVDPDRLTFSKAGATTTVKPRSMAVCVELVQADGEVVQRRELLQKVWGDAEVTDDVLTQSIVELRRALGDDASQPVYIETIKRVGFRLIPQPQAAQRSGRLRAAHIAATAALAFALTLAAWFLVRDAPTPVEQSIAVLPFKNLSIDPENRYFGDGLAEELLNSLAQIPELRVPARTSSFAFRDRDMDIRQIGASLDVAYVLEGSVRKSGDQIRVTAQLIDVADGYHRWSKTYDRELNDIFAVQDEIAGAIADALTLRVVERPVVAVATSPDPSAYLLYLAAREHRRAGRFERARGLFRQAIERDAGYAPAHAGLAQSLVFFQENATALRQSGTDFAARKREAENAVATATRLAPDSAEVHLARASIEAAERNVNREAEALREALSANPTHVDAHIRLSANLAGRDLYSEALARLDEAARIDPLNPELAVQHASLLALFQGYDAAAARLNHLVDLGLPSPRILDALVNHASIFGRFVDRVAYATKLVEAAPAESWARAQLADAFTELGELELAEQWIIAAEEISPLEAFKARARWLATTGQTPAFRELVTGAITASGALEAEELTPVQSALTGLYGIAVGFDGRHSESARLFQRVFENSPSILRRSPHQRVYALVRRARQLRHAGQLSEMTDVLSDAEELIEQLARKGIAHHPWITMSEACVAALRGRDSDAQGAFNRAYDEGWRAWLLEQYGFAEPLTGYSGVAALLEDDIAEMRAVVRERGLAQTPTDLLNLPEEQ